MTGCNGKIPYATRRLAERAALRIHRRKPEGPKPVAYECQACAQWHFGRRIPSLERKRWFERKRARCDG